MTKKTIPWSVPNLYELHSNPEKLLHYGNVEFVIDQEILDDMGWVYIDWKNGYADEMEFEVHVAETFHNMNLPHSIEVFMSGDDGVDTDDRWDKIGALCDFFELFYKTPTSQEPTPEDFMKWYTK
jgi:hypothetical protein